jgi:RHH-type rel operon transcriptional repressor/antitoxin RelB
VVEHLEDLEDVYMAEQTLEKIRRGEEQVVDAE